MRAVCPSCEAVYEVPDRLIGTGRRLRCANCGHQWTLRPEPPAAVAPPPAEPPPFKETPPPPPSHYTGAPDGAPPARPMLRRPPQAIDQPPPPLDAAGAGRGGRGADPALRAAWIGSVLAVLLALGALWSFRHEIAAAWPPAARLVGTPTGGG